MSKYIPRLDQAAAANNDPDRLRGPIFLKGRVGLGDIIELTVRLRNKGIDSYHSVTNRRMIQR